MSSPPEQVAGPKNVRPDWAFTDNFLEEMDQIPLFMKSLPEDGGEDNITLQALQALAYEGTPEGMSWVDEVGRGDTD
jgi:hypothetical protein